MKDNRLIESASKLGLDGLDQFPDTDAAKLLGVLRNLLVGFQRRDASMLADVYSADADWVNAFGSVKEGAAEIVDYLRGLFADANFNDGEVVAPPRSAIRRLCDDVAVVSTHLQVSGQGLVGGGSIALRDNHSLHVLRKRPDGRWEVVSEMYMDARTDWSYVGHS
ncbi:MAG TPA: SgcJ/EcaC family oxidoreductase [Galbitalea sp.]|jgi:uncharacterized protein (TIGR02246 family)